ncbi:hypothetical protein BXZ70DRAFT_344461 [Cristinia sonorae]|uniref:Uncharacterized protein n=1 Tax=Cristinia sonorae TaxID=1940300 RepID=A0A8K0XNQ2_9AGAR|nr:hypothetical protein BXZ70DRAFT_344461 [Cristinia sonorae]
MLEPSHVDHISMPVPQYPPSDESEGTFRSELRNLVDSRLPLPDDPSSSFASTQSGHVAPRGDGRSSSPERQKRSSKKDRHALAQRELSRMLASEEAEVKSMRKYLKAALDRLDGETRRAQEAERRALEIAERFRVVNEARQTAQSELTRVTEELRLWRNQFENAQKEILRARDVFKDLEEQRNSAESDATRYRTLARKLNEERMINKAREEGRKEGYEEGLRRGMEQGRSDAYNSRSRRDEVLVEDDDEDIRGRGVPDNGPADEIQSVMSESIAPLNIPTRVPLNNLSLRGGTQFHEHFTPTSTATRSLAPVQETSEPRMARPPSVIHNRPPSIGRPDSTPPPDNWIPELDPATNTFAVPPAHVMNRSPSSLNPPLPDSSNISANYAQVPETNVKDIYPQKSRSSPPSIAESIQSSTATSQYEILAPTRGQGQRKEREIPRQMLDRIDEVSSSMEHSPGMEKRAMPTAVTFPVASAGDPEWEGSHGSRSRKTSHQSLGHGSPRSRTLSQGGGHRQMLSNESRYSQSSIDSWRRDAASTLDPPKQYPAAASVSKPAYPSGLRHEVNPPTSSRDDRPRSATTPRPRSPAGPRSTTPVGNRLDVQARLRSLQASPSSGISSSTEFNIVVEPPVSIVVLI